MIRITFLFLCFVVVCLLVLSIYGVFLIISVPTLTAVFMTVGLAFTAVIIIYCMTRSAIIRANVALLICATMVGLYSVQTLSVMFLNKNSNPIVSPQTAYEKVIELRTSGVEVYPAVFPWVFVRNNKTFSIEGNAYLPLSSIGRKRTVYCNETGEFLVYTADEYGFLNPPSAWKKQAIDVLLVGDSFTHGACVPPADNISAQLQHKVSAISIGMGGNGPLLMLAGLREFAPKAKAKTVAWLYFEGNDLYELEYEKRNAVLQSYLNDSSFRQDLLKNQKAIDNVLTAYAEEKILEQRMAFEAAIASKGFLQRLIGFLMLRPLRNLIGLRAGHTPKEDSLGGRLPFNIGKADFQTFTRVLKSARDNAVEHQAKFIFVYLPDHPSRGSKTSQIHAYKKVIAIVERLKIPLLDMRAVFSVRKDLSVLYSCEDCHYSKYGYAVVASRLAEFIHAQTASSDVFHAGGSDN